MCLWCIEHVLCWYFKGLTTIDRACTELSTILERKSFHVRFNFALFLHLQRSLSKTIVYNGNKNSPAKHFYDNNLFDNYFLAHMHVCHSHVTVWNEHTTLSISYLCCILHSAFLKFVSLRFVWLIAQFLFEWCIFLNKLGPWYMAFCNLIDVSPILCRRVWL